MRELTLGEMQFVSGGSSNTRNQNGVNLGDVALGAGYFALGAVESYMAVDTFGLTLPGAGAAFAHSYAAFQAADL
ncbi:MULTISPECIES: hypothetical protein [Acidihalobacter]|nr:MULTISPECIES: hypothetical protein [Acidihalobacter]